MSNSIGILDPDGVNLNPINNKVYSDKYKELSKKWREFPAYEKAKDVIKMIKDNNVILVTSGTGSGKTVLVPKYCLHALNYTGKIAVTLPKQIIAKSAAEFAAVTLDVELGKDVGYQYRGSGNTQSKDNKLLYATDGTIVARLLTDPLLTDFDSVIIDEAHERKVQIDFLLYLLKNVVDKRPEFKLIIMSATINVDIFKDYYSDYNFAYVDIGGKTNYEIESVFLKENISENEYLDKGLSIIKKLIKTTDDGDILFFVTSITETTDVCKKLEDEDDQYCIEVYSGINKDTQELAQDKVLYKTVSGKKRKIVIATNVAESSLTIDGIKYVVDSGLELFSYYDPKIRSNVLIKQFVTHAQAKQRMGRAGRTEPGTCYHLYSKETFDKLMKRFPEPNIRTSNLYDEFLKLLSIESVGNVSNLQSILSKFIEPPDDKYIDASLEILRDLSLIKDGKLSKLGLIVSELQADPMESLCIYAAHHLNCAKEVIAIIAMINASKGSLTQLFNLPIDIVGDEDTEQLKYLRKKFDTARDVFNNRYGDHLSLLKMFNTYSKKRKNEDELKKWIYKFFLKRSTFEKARDTYKKYYSMYKRSINEDKIQINDIMNYNTAYRVMASFMFGYRINLGIASKGKVNTDFVKNTEISRYSFLNYDVKMKKIILYYELFTSSKVNMNIVSTVPKKSVSLYELFGDKLKVKLSSS